VGGCRPLRAERQAGIGDVAHWTHGAGVWTAWDRRSDDVVIAALGILSGCLTTLSWVPQLRRTWKRGHADDISGMYLFTFGTGVVGWIVYGALKADFAVIFANALTFVLLACLLSMKYGRTVAPVDNSAPAPDDAARPRPMLRRG